MEEKNKGRKVREGSDRKRKETEKMEKGKVILFYRLLQLTFGIDNFIY